MSIFYSNITSAQSVPSLIWRWLSEKIEGTTFSYPRILRAAGNEISEIQEYSGYRGNIREMRKSVKICHIRDTGLRNKSNFRPEENLIENNR